MLPTPHTDAFLAREDLVLAQRGTNWTIETASGYRVMTLAYGASDGMPEITFYVNTANSSRHFPMTDACLQMFWDDIIFDVEAALRWLDDLIQGFTVDIGAYRATILTGRSDAAHFREKGYTRVARSYQFTRRIRPSYRRKGASS